MLKTNKKDLPMLIVQGQVTPPRFSQRGKMDIDGGTVFVPGTGGVTLNAQIGDRCVGWAADHLEPGVSSRNPNDDFNVAYVCYSCIGNKAIVVSGDAKGAEGFVTGKHGGCEHLMVYFPQDALEKMTIEDKIKVRAQGQGMTLLDYPDIALRSISPELLEKMNITEKNGKLTIGAAKIVPAAIMGSGLGMGGTASGDYDITLFDKKISEEYGLYDLRFGDIVAITDADTRFGRTYLSGAVTIGVVSHGDCLVPGHGPGVTTLMSCKSRLIEPVLDPKANLADMFL